MSPSTNLSSLSRPMLMDLPCELKAMIWDESMPDNISEVCILLHQADCTGQSGTQFYGTLTVDTAFPVIMHVCNEARHYAMKHTRFRYSPAARIMVPFRLFQPELDVLYIEAIHNSASMRAIQDMSLSGIVQHVALNCWKPLCVATPLRPSSAMSVFSSFPMVKTLSIVLPSSEGVPSRRKLYPLTPTRRFRLEQFYTGPSTNTNIISAFRNIDLSTKGVLTFLHRIRCDIAMYHTRMWRTLGPRSGIEGGFIDVNLNAQYFTAWSPDSSPGRCGMFRDSLRFPEAFRQYDMADMQTRGGLNPEEIRVNDLR
ncbi:hypothetical protein SCUP515_07621 [Seiridium cupressi]